MFFHVSFIVPTKNINVSAVELSRSQGFLNLRRLRTLCFFLQHWHMRKMPHMSFLIERFELPGSPLITYSVFLTHYSRRVFMQRNIIVEMHPWPRTLSLGDLDQRCVRIPISTCYALFTHRFVKVFIIFYW